MSIKYFLGLKHRTYYSAIAILCCFVYGYLGYFTVRSEFFQLIFLTSIAFLGTYFLIEKSHFSFKQLFALAVLYRLVLILCIPGLSQDFFRFYWDGQLILEGLNPFLENVNFYLENKLISQISNAEILKEGMGELSAGNYSNYPPLSQFIYAIASWFSNGSIFGFIIILRLILISFDIIFILFAKKLLLYLRLSPRLLFFYVLNPLCILELTANLHLEGVMIALFIASIYVLVKQQYLLSGVLIGLSVGTKLLSLIAIPLVMVYLWKIHKDRRSIKSSLNYILGFTLVLCVQFLPFISIDFIKNFSESVGLWFNTFEFNASIYYVVRWLGYLSYGYNIIQTYGVIMPVLTILIFILLIFRMTPSSLSVMRSLMWMMVAYFLLSTTVHPWYILFPLAMSIFTRHRFIYLWSFLVFLSYFAYRSSDVQESLVLISFEYLLVILMMIYELRSKKSSTNLTK